MITDAILSFLMAPIVALLEQIPISAIAVPDGVMSSLRGMFGVCGYIFPMGAITACMTLILSLYTVKIVMAIIVRVKSFVPTMGA